VCATSGHVLALSADPEGRVIYTLTELAGDRFLRCFLRASGSIVQPMGQALLERWDEEPQAWYLEPTASTDGDAPRVALSGPRGLVQFSGWYLQPGPPDNCPADWLNTRLMVRDGDGGTWDWADRTIRYTSGEPPPHRLLRWVPNWSPAPGAIRPLDWLTPAAGLLEVTGVDADGVLHWSAFDARSSGTSQQRAASVTDASRFRAACLVSPGVVAAVTGRNELHWLKKIQGGSLRRQAVSKLAQPGEVVALVSRPAANEVVAVFADGSVSRIPRA
jgi:hypothetical protein